MRTKEEIEAQIAKYKRADEMLGCLLGAPYKIYISLLEWVLEESAAK